MRHVSKDAMDRDIALTAMKQIGIALRYAKDSLRADKNACTTALRYDSSAIEFVPECIQTDRDVCAASRPNAFTSAMVSPSLHAIDAVVLHVPSR